MTRSKHLSAGRDWHSVFARGVQSARRPAVVIATSFATIGAAWVLSSDVLLYLAFDDAELRARMQIAFDWLFVLVASGVLYVLAYRAGSRIGRARAVLASIVENIGDALVVLGPDRKIVHANPAALRMLAVEDTSQLIGMTAPQFSRRYLVSRTSGALVAPEDFIAQRAFSEPEGLHGYKAVLYPSPESPIVVAASVTAVRSRPGRTPAFVVSILHDVTDTERLEELRDQFFAAAAHALKTPIAVIKANVQFIAPHAPAAVRPSFLAVERQCDRIDRLVQNLQVVSRARSHSLQLYPQAIELAPLVEQTARELADARRCRDVRTEFLALPRIRADRERLVTVLRNLSSDAIRAALPHSSLTLRLSLHGSMAEVAVLYECLAVAERTFAGLEQYDDSTLSRCATETIVEAHGGRVGEELSDREGTLWVRLPTIEDLP